MAVCLSVSPYRFGVLVEAAAQFFDVFEVRCKGSVVEREVPLPGGAPLLEHPIV